MAGFVQKNQKYVESPRMTSTMSTTRRTSRTMREEFVSPIESRRTRKSTSRHASSSSSSYSSSGKVVNIHATAQLQVVLFKPQNFAARRLVPSRMSC